MAWRCMRPSDGALARRAALEVLDLGRCEYGAATARMLDLVEARARAAAGGPPAPDRVLLCEFEPVITVGRGGGAPSRAAGLPVFAVSRGGRATWHGPGQVVAYPIVYLPEGARDLRAYLRALEEALIRTVGDFGLRGARDPRGTGCWVNGRKIASIGVAVRRWVTYHGVALNVDPDLAFFRRLEPCGLDPELMTSIARELGARPPLPSVKEALVRRIQEVLRG